MAEYNVQYNVKQEGEWFCSKHPSAATLFCQDHSRAVCMTCALVDHQHPCNLFELRDVIQEKREALSNLRGKLVNAERLDYTSKIHKCRENVDKHLMSVKSAVDVDFAETIRKLDNENENRAIIDQEIDRRNDKLYDDIRRIKLEIDKNEEERVRRHQQIKILSDDKRSTIRKQQGELVTVIQTIVDEIGKIISAFERTLQEQTRDEEEIKRVLDTTLEGNDETVVRETEQIETSVNDVLGKHTNDDTLEQILCRAFNVKYIESEGIGLGRILQVGSLEHVEEWKCVSSIKVTNQIKQPTIVGYMNDGKVIITDWGQGSRKDTYTLNTTTDHIQKVISTTDASYVVSCAMLTNGRVACGRYVDGPPSDSLPECIIVYDTNHCDVIENPWTKFKSINIRIGIMRHQPANVFVATAPDGKIIAIEDGQRNIYFIDSETGGTVNTIKGIDTMVLRGVQSSGHIVAQASPAGRKKQLYVVKGEGDEDVIKTQDLFLNASVVPETNDIYAVSMVRSQKVCHTYVIWKINVGGEKSTEKLDITFCDKLKDLGNSKTHILTSRVIFVTPTEMIVSDGESILRYRKS